MEALEEGTRVGDPAALYATASLLLDQNNFSEARAQLLLTMMSATQKEVELYRLNAQFSLGLIELHGFAPESQKEKGLAYLREVAEFDASTALRTVPPTLSSAISLVVAAEYQLGKAYAEGNGVPIDLNEAEKWWLRASRQGSGHGSVDAQFQLGSLYSSSRRLDSTNPLEMTPPDIPKAVHWHEAASRHGHVDSAFSLGQLLLTLNGKKDRERAITLLRTAAQKGHIGAIANLALQYFELRMHDLAFSTAQPLTALADDVNDSVLQSLNITQSEREFRSLASFICGRCFEIGVGVAKDAKAAQTYYRRATILDKTTSYLLRSRVEHGEL